MADVEKIAYIEMYVTDIEYSKGFFINTLNFQEIAMYKKHQMVKILIQHDKINIILTSSTSKENKFYDHVLMHGDGIKKIAFITKDVAECFNKCVNNGAKPIVFPKIIRLIHCAIVEVYNKIEHEFINECNIQKLDGFIYQNVLENKIKLFRSIDHIALCFEKIHIKKWSSFYIKALNFVETREENINSSISGMETLVIESKNSNIKFPIVAPLSKESPLQDFLLNNNGSGVHHIAFLTHNIEEAVKFYLEKRGTFRQTPYHYYNIIRKKFPHMRKVIDRISALHILYDEDIYGSLMQIFTTPIVYRKTLFLEFIQRKKSNSFGSGNIQALYESLELEKRLKGDKK